MTKESKNIMVGILAAFGVIGVIELAVGGVILGVTHHQAKKALKEFEKSAKEFDK